MAGDILKWRAKMATTYDTSRYDQLYTDFEKKQKEDAAKQKQRTEEDYNKKLKEAYISRHQEQKNLASNLQKAGIRGGATETSNLKLATNYQNNRKDVEQQKTRALQNIEDNANTNIFNYKQQNDAAKIAYVEQREAEDRQLAQNQKEKEEAAQQDLLTAKYGGYYSIPSLNAAYNKATSTQEKAIIQARINYLNAYAKGY